MEYQITNIVPELTYVFGWITWSRIKIDK